jgi:hypothetical protein
LGLILIGSVASRSPRKSSKTSAQQEGKKQGFQMSLGHEFDFFLEETFV